MSKLCCGFAQTDITPIHPEEVFLDGYGHRIAPAKGVLDPIFCKVSLIQYEQKEFAVIVLDICGLNANLKDYLCHWITALTGLKRQDFALCVTHTHAAPACGVLAGLPINYLYWNYVGQQIGQAVEAARKKVKAGEFRFTSGGEFSLPMNRRGKEIINRNIFVGAFYDEANTLQGVIASAACHAVCNTDYTISADYPGVLTQKASTAFPGVPFLFLQGRGADINPPCGGIEGIQSMGNELTDRIFTALKRTQETNGVQGEFTSLFRCAKIPMCYPSKDILLTELADFKAQATDLSADAAARRYPEVELIWHSKALEAIETKQEPYVDADLQMVSIGGSFVMVFVSFELLTTTGNTIEAMLSSYNIDPDKCFVIGYANGTNGYLCPSAESGQDGYETRLAAHWYSLPECCEKSEETVLCEVADMAKTLLENK